MTGKTISSPTLSDRSTKRRPDPSRSLRLLSVRDAAAYAGVSATTVRRWIKEGKIKIYRAGAQIRINEDDLILFLDCH